MTNIQSLDILLNWDNRCKEMYFEHHDFGSQINTWAKEYREINNKWFTNKDLEKISYRTIGYWDEKGYLTGEKKAGGKWRKFDFFQFLWIQLLDALRKMGVSHDVVVPAIFKAFGYIQETTKEELKTLKEGLSDNQQIELMKLYGNQSNFQTTFRFYVMYALFLKKAVSIRYYLNGHCDVIKGITAKSDAKELKEYFKDNSASFVAISINELIHQFITEKDEETINNISILSDNELELLRHLRRKEVSEVTVFLEEGKPIRLDIKDVHQNEELNKRVYEYMLAPYQKIEFKTNGGKTAFFERITTIKLNEPK